MNDPKHSIGSRQASAPLSYFWSVVCLGVSDAAGKWLAAAYPVGQIVFVRCLVAALTNFAAYRQNLAALRHLPYAIFALHMLRGFVICLVNYLFFWGASLIPLANALSIFLVGSLIAALAGCLLFKEGRLLSVLIANLVALLGAILVLNPADGTNLLGGLLVLLSAAGYALGMVLTKYAVQVDAESNTSILGNVFAMLFAALTIPFAWRQPTGHDLGIFLLIGVAAGLATALSVYAMRRGNMSSLMVLDYSIVVLGMIADFFLWSQTPAFTMLGGAALIVIASLANEWLGKKGANTVSAPLETDKKPAP
jgi:drug/metabolite transporter (DMT)-like permease